jgi:hypothetical protein
MLRNKPKLSYCGLTIILSNPSRFDTVSLLSSTGGFLLNDCLTSSYSRLHCDVRLKEEQDILLPKTQAILLLGESALHKYLPNTINNSLHEMRGSYFEKGAFGLPTIATYLPQDAADFKNYEAQFNPEAEDFTEDGYVDEDDDTENEDLKGMGRTKRANYAFWIKADCAKIISILKGEVPQKTKPKLILEPDSKDVVECLLDNKDKDFLFDMETDYEDQNMLCFAFSFDYNTIYCVPIIDYNYRLYSSNTGRILCALQEAIKNNTTVAHNGGNFDFLVLAMKYRIAIKRVYDTMIAQHRIYPACEKSLGHCVSLWTWEKFHKDMDSKSYRSREDMIKKLTYCGHDVFTMGLVKKEQDKFAQTIPGLSESIQVANDSIRPYLTCMMQGIRYDDEELKRVSFNNDRLMEQYIRITNMLLGPVGLQEVKRGLKGTSKAAFPGSNKQCVEYFHNILEYPVVFKSQKTGEPSLGKKSLFKLALKYPDNPVIRLVILYRLLKKETSALQFNPWKNNNGKIFPRVKEII